MNGACNEQDLYAKHRENVKKFIDAQDYSKAIFYSLQLPLNDVQKELKIISTAVANTPQYKDLSHTIDRIRVASLNYEHMKIAKELVHDGKYPQAAFHCMQLPIEAIGKVSKRLGIDHIIDDILGKEK